MTETNDIIQRTDDSFSKYIPILTAICCAASIVLFVGINSGGKLDNWDVYKKWGAPSAIDIFGGSYWGLITSNFLHTEIWHLALNLYWLWHFGKKIEFETNKALYGLLILTSALVSSLAQLAISDSTGIGLSGVGYALFGFILAKSKTTREYQNYLEKKTINLFALWLVVCIVLTQAKVWRVGNAAHIGGLGWGLTMAYIVRFDKYVRVSIAVLLLAVLSSSIFWSPFSTAWLSHQAFELQKAQRTDEALTVYQRILDRDSENEFARENKKLIEVQKLSEKAMGYHTQQKYVEARQIYKQILALDKNNEWAKENLTRLPHE